MLTLKVITTDSKGELDTHLYSAKVISHSERTSNDYGLSKTLISSGQVLGEMIEKISDQKFIFSTIFFYDDDDSYIRKIHVLPHADCYIMEGGKTIDSFKCCFL